MNNEQDIIIAKLNEALKPVNREAIIFAPVKSGKITVTEIKPGDFSCIIRPLGTGEEPMTAEKDIISKLNEVAKAEGVELFELGPMGGSSPCYQIRPLPRMSVAEEAYQRTFPKSDPESNLATMSGFRLAARLQSERDVKTAEAVLVECLDGYVIKGDQAKRDILAALRAEAPEEK